MTEDEELDDLVLLDRWCGGDRDAGTRLFRRHYGAIYRFLSRKVDSDLDELVQETFLALVRKRDQFRRDSSFRTFLFAIARLSLHEHWRRMRRRDATIDFDEISLASLSTSMASRLAHREDRTRLLDALRELPLDQQLLLELHYWEKLEGADLAAVFHVEPATIRSRMFRAREALRDRIRQSENERSARDEQDARDQRDQAPGDADFDAWARGLRPVAEDA
jgi:RNA polymerase sigma-70 factor (ECF subfamily)